MTSPTEPTQPQTAQPPSPEPGQSAPGTPQSGAQPPAATGAQPEAGSAEERLQRAEAQLAAERRRVKDAERQLAQVKAEHMTEADKALAKARADGATEARREAGVKLAAAEFRAAAAGVLADPEAALEALDLARFVSDDGEVDRRKIADLVKRLAAALPAPPAGKIPPGAHGAAPNDDFLGIGIRGTGRR